MLSEELHTVTFILCPYDNLSIPVRAKTDFGLYKCRCMQPWKLQFWVGFLLKFLWIKINSEILTESRRAKWRPSVAEMIMLQFKAVKIWPNLIM